MLKYTFIVQYHPQHGLCLKGQCQAIFYFCLKYSTWALYESAKTVLQTFFVFSRRSTITKFDDYISTQFCPQVGPPPFSYFRKIAILYVNTP